MKTRSKVRRAKAGGCLTVGFFGIFAVLGGAAFYFLSWKPFAGILAARAWSETECVILSSRVAESRGSDSTTYRVEVTYSYEVDGQAYRGDRYDFSVGSSSGYAAKARAVAAHPPGSETSCYFAPGDPSRSVIDRSPGGYLWWSLFPLPFVAIGVGGMFFALSPAGRRRVAARRRKTGVTFRAPDAERPRGSLELAADSSPLGKLVGFVMAALVWNGIVGVFFVQQRLPDWRSGDIEWLPTLFMIPFVLVGLVLLGAVVYQFLALFNPRPRLVLDRGYLTPGSESPLRWEVSGQAGRLDRLTLRLEGRETVRYRRGTNTYTDRHVFFSAELLNEARFSRRPRGQILLQIPASTMPTFEADNNRIEWRLTVRGDIPFWPDMKAEFPLRLYPS